MTVYPRIKGTQRITRGPDGALWFTNASGDGIGRITTAAPSIGR